MLCNYLSNIYIVTVNFVKFVTHNNKYKEEVGMTGKGKTQKPTCTVSEIFQQAISMKYSVNTC